MSVVLKTTLVVTEIKKKTKAKMFKDLKVGDYIRIRVSLTGPGRGRGTYASYVSIENVNTGDSAYKSMNELDPILDCFEFKEVRD